MIRSSQSIVAAVSHNLWASEKKNIAPSATTPTTSAQDSTRVCEEDGKVGAREVACGFVGLD
jgi:hypothetical protein